MKFIRPGIFQQRAALNRRARALVAAEVSKDLTHVPFYALPAHLRDVVAF